MEIIIDVKTTPDWLTIDDIMGRAQVSRTVAYEMAHDIGITRVARNAIRVNANAFGAYMASRTSPPRRKPNASSKQIQKLAAKLAELTGDQL